jgi:hypothetical protein
MLVRNPRAPTGLFTGIAFDGSLAGEYRGSTYYHDASGLGRNGTLTSMDPPTDWPWSDELAAHAVDFDGSNDYVAGPAWGPLATSITVSAWIKPAVVTTGYVCGNANSGAFTSGAISIYADGRLQWRNAGSGGIFYNGTALTAGAWRHIALTREGTAGAAIWYLDGAVDNTAASLTATQTNTGQRFCLGRLGDYAGYPYFSGLLAAAIVWQRVLDPAEANWIAQRQNKLWVPWERTSWPSGVVAGPVEAAVVSTLGSLSQQATASVVVQAAAVSSLGALSQAATAAVWIHAEAVGTLGAMSQAVAVETAAGAAGVSTLGALGQAAAGQVLAQAEAGNTLGALSQQLAGVVEADGVQAAITSTLGALDQQLAGEVVPLTTATIVSTLGSLSQSLDATAPATAEAVSTLGSLSQVVAGEATIHWYADTIRLADSTATEVRHLAVRGTLPGVVPLLAAARNGPGTASLRYTSAGAAQYRAPGSATWGPAVTVPLAAVITDDTYILRDGDDPDCWLRVQVYADYLPSAATTVDVELADVVNNTIGQANCSAADATAGEVISWEITCTAQAAIAGTDHSATALTFWLTQPASGTIEISDDNATWVSPTTEGAGLVLGTVAAGASTTLYCRRTIAPGSIAAPTLLSQLHASFTYWGKSYYLDARGRFRIFNAAGFNLHFGSLVPDEDGTPDDFASTLPFSPADVLGDGTYYFSAAAYNGCMASGFYPVGPLGEQYLRLEIDGGAEIENPPAAPREIRLEARAGGVVRIHAFVALDPTADDLPSEWAIAYTVDGTTPAADSPDLTATLTPGALAILQYDLPAAADGATVTVRLQTRRNDGTTELPDWNYSDSVLDAVAADAVGPTTPLYLGAGS